MPSTYAFASRPANARPSDTAALASTPHTSIVPIRRKRSSRCSCASGTTMIATRRNDGENRRNSCVVSAPNSGVVASGTTSSVKSDSARPIPRASMTPASRWARPMSRRCTSGLPTPSLAVMSASSRTITATASMPN